MLFQYTLDLIISGEKSQTRRIAKPNEFALRGRHNRILAVLQDNREKWRVGREYAIQPGRGQQQIARMVIKSIRSEKLYRVSTADAMAEGFINRSEFFKTWQSIHGTDALDNRVWVITFEVIAILQEHLFGVNLKYNPEITKVSSHHYAHR